MASNAKNLAELLNNESTIAVADVADGSNTSFTLSDATTANDAFVFYNGVMMQPTTDYGISGVTLTFTFTPVNSSNIMVRYQV